MTNDHRSKERSTLFHGTCLLQALNMGTNERRLRPDDAKKMDASTLPLLHYHQICMRAQPPVESIRHSGVFVLDCTNLDSLNLQSTVTKWPSKK